MLSWFASRAADSTDEPVQHTSPLLPEQGLWLRLDLSGKIVEFGGHLAGRFASRLVGTAFSQLLAAKARVFPPEIQDWQPGLCDVDLREQDGQVLSLRGWLQKNSDGWLLLLLEVNDLLVPLREQESRRYWLSMAGRLARRLKDSRETHLAHNAQEAMRELVAWLNISQASLLVKQPGLTWQFFAHHHQHRDLTKPPSAQAYGLELERMQGSAEQLQFTSAAATGIGPVYMLSYRAQDDWRVGLVLSGFDAAAQTPWLTDQDWQQFVGQLSEGLLIRLRQYHAQQEQGRISALQHLLGVGWWEFHPNQKTIELAPILAQELQLNRSEIALAQWLECVYPADRDELRVRLNNMGDGVSSFTQNLRLLTRAGARWYQVQAQALNQSGRQRICGFILDISEIKAQQASASAANARMQSLLANTPAVIYVQSCAQGALQFEYCSESLQPLLGWELGHLQNGGLAELLHEEDRESYFERNRRVLSESLISLRYRVRDRAGIYHWLLDEARLLRDEQGIPQEIVGVWLDVTEVTESAQRIQQSEERYRILVEDSPAMICRYSPDLILNFANWPLARYLDCEPKQLVGADLSQWLSEEQRQAFIQRLTQLTPEQPLSTAEICMSLPGREHAWWVWSDRGIFDDQGRLAEVQAVARDNTEVRRAEQQLLQSAKMATLGEMAAGMAHEMNQPLNVMRMAVTNIQRKLDAGESSDDYLREKLLRIEMQVNRAAKVVDHMRVFGRRSDIEPSLFEPNAAINGALSLLEEGLRSKGVELEVELWLGEPLRVLGFIDQLEQVLINLMVNARDAMLSKKEKKPELKPWIGLRINREGQRVHLLVEDNGGGIDVHIINKIFEPFFTTKSTGKGTGLGLSVSFSIVEGMGGVLSVTNTEHGARFCIDLPLQAPESAPAAGPSR